MSALRQKRTFHGASFGRPLRQRVLGLVAHPWHDLAIEDFGIGGTLDG
jgi:hypothetical protein